MKKGLLAVTSNPLLPQLCHKGANQMTIVKVTDSLSQVTVKLNGCVESAIAAHDQVISVGIAMIAELKNS